MELYRNTANRMTRWLVATGALKTSFVLIDIGVQGGISPRWSALGDHLTVYGFDLLEEAIAPLVRSAGAREHYFVLGLADRDGEVEIVLPSNRYETQLYSPGPDGAPPYRSRPGERRRVQVRRLDTLSATGLIEPADFIKMDCEGHEPVVLRGAADYLAKSNLIGTDTESNFNISQLIPNTNFCECSDLLVGQRLMVFDIQFDRAPAAGGKALAGVQRPNTLNVLFARNLAQERDWPSSYVRRRAERPADPQTILKTAIVFEAYGLFDWALTLLQTLSSDLGQYVDVEKAIAELKAGAEALARPEPVVQVHAEPEPVVQAPAQPQLTASADSQAIRVLEQQIHAMEASTSWRVTIPLRAIKKLLAGGAGRK